MTNKLTIRTNNKPRPIIYWHELTEEQRKEFDFTSADGCSYVKYKSCIHCISEFMRVDGDSPLKGWHGYESNSFFSGTLVKFCEDTDYVIMGEYYS